MCVLSFLQNLAHALSLPATTFAVPAPLHLVTNFLLQRIVASLRQLQKLKAGTYEFFTEAQTVTQKAEFNYNILAQGMQT